MKTNNKDQPPPSKLDAQLSEPRSREPSRGQSRLAPADRIPLSRSRIVAAALAIVEARGLSGLTFRHLGRELGCEAMSIYHHFPSKQHLLDALVEHAIAGVREPSEDLGPIERLRFICWEYRAMAHRYPKLFQLIALHRHNMPKGVVFLDRVLQHFHAAIPDEELAAQSFRVFGYYLVGAALDETAGYAAGPSAAEPATDDFIARECRLLSTAAPYFKQPHWERTFALGLETLLKGVVELRATLVAQAKLPPKPAVSSKSG